MTTVRFVLVAPEYPSNIGASARAMKTMGFRDLWLVRPRRFPHPEARRLATEAVDVLDAATVTESLDEALADCHVSIATSGRARSADWPSLTAEEAAARGAATPGKVAIVFGPEPSGLRNEDLYRCRYQSWIPTAEDCSSLNLGQAVQLYAYAFRRALVEQPTTPDDREPCTDSMLARLHAELEQTVQLSGFARYDSAHLMLRFQRIFNRAELSSREASMLTGLFARLARQLDDAARRADSPDSSSES